MFTHPRTSSTTADMSRNNSAGHFMGFSIFQPALGATLQWLPALGSHELEDMIHTFLPGPASIQDKRAHISMDFCEYSRQTGETFKFYPIYTGYTGSFASTTTDSPASSSAMHDSGYGSSFNVSPTVSSMSPWAPSLTVSTPASTASDSRTKSRSGPSQKKSSSSSSKQVDFSNHPGMRILTKDGRDITNSASRGCKSKEQRDHAHLMRVIKACDACRRKKVRCEPGHKKRTASQTQPSRLGPKQTKKPKTAVYESRAMDSSLAMPSSVVSVPSLEMQMAPTASSEGLNENPDDFWQQFVRFDDQTIPLPEDYGFFLEPTGHVSSSSDGSSFASPSQSFMDRTPALQDSYGASPILVGQESALPYLNPGDSYGTNYQDFNLYSPTSDPLDEEPQFVGKSRRKERVSKQDNLRKPSYQQATDQTLYIHRITYHLSGHDRQPDDPFDTSFSDWSPIKFDSSGAPIPGCSAGGLHEHVAATIDAGKYSVGDAGEQRPPRPPPSLGTFAGLAVHRSFSSAHDRVPPLHPSSPTSPLSVLTDFATASASRQQVSASAFINGRLFTRRDDESPDRTFAAPVSQGRRARAETRLTDTAQAHVSHRIQTAEGHSSAAQSRVVSRAAFAAPIQQAARRELLVRGALVLERGDYFDVVAREQATCAHSSRPVSHDSGIPQGTYGPCVSAGLRDAPHAHFVGSGCRPTALPPGADAVRASPVLPWSPTRQVAASALPWPTTAAGSICDLAIFALAYCLVASLMRWSSTGGQLELLFALSVSTCLRPSYGRGRKLDGSRSATTKAARALWRASREMTALCLAG